MISDKYVERGTFMEFVPLKIFSGLSIHTLYTVYLVDFEQDFHFPGETHDFWELGCVLRGRSGNTSGEHIYECSPYELVIHPPNVFHTSWCEGSEGVTIMTITFTGKGPDYLMPMGKFILTEEEKQYADCLAAAIPRTFCDTDNTEYKPIRVQEGVSQEKIQYFKNILELLILSLGQRNREAAQPAAGKYSSQFTAIARYMNDHVCDALNTDALCTVFGISRSTMKDLFHRFTGGGVMEYYHHLRISHAVSLMNSGMSMAEISQAMNFSSQNYFSSFFKRETGLSPAEYRKKKL